MAHTGRGMARYKAETTGQAGPGNRAPAFFDVGVVTAVKPGQAADGHAIVTVRWNGADVPAPYPDSYFPGINDVVLLAVQGPKVSILCHLIGTPQ